MLPTRWRAIPIGPEYSLDKPLHRICLDKHGDLGHGPAAWPGGLAGLGLGRLAHLERGLAPSFATVCLGDSLLIWQNVQFWRYMRYFLPIYPFIILFAAWALVEIYDRTRESRARLAANGTKFALQFSDRRPPGKGWRVCWRLA